jgi:monovalent cation/hydrogen antiporter
MTTFEVLLGLMALCTGLAAMAQKIKVPLAVPLILAGMALAFIPGLPEVRLDPELALALFLPPLLQLGAYRTDWPAFRENLRPILLLAVGAVFFSAAAVAVVAHLVVPDLPWWAAVALGAIVAPPDAVAAAAVLKDFNLPKRLVVVLEGESLINDASSLVLYRFAVAAVAAGSVSYGHGALQFVGMAVGGALVGWLVGRIAIWIFAKIDDTMLDITVSLLAGFGAYFAAEAIHASGVLGAVACGLVLGRQQHAEFSARSRLDLNAVWNFTEFLLTSLIFMLMGLQLRGIVERLTSFRSSQLAVLALAVSAALVISRFVWIYGSSGALRLLPGRLRPNNPVPANQLAVLAWTGMRGVVSLAAALALPAQFPGRDIIVFLAFCAIFATLVLQGTTLGWLVRRLGVVEPEPEAAQAQVDTAQARAELANAALQAVKSELHQGSDGEHAVAASELVREYEVKADHAAIDEDDPEESNEQRLARYRLRLVAIAAQRDKLLDQTAQLDAENHRALLEEIDLEEQRIRKAMGDE